MTALPAPQHVCDPAGKLCPECMRAWLDRPPENRRSPRELCELLDHQWAEERRGAPVTEFLVCLRCGKIGERL